MPVASTSFSFPLYLLPAIPFRRPRRRSSATTTSSTSSTSSASSSPPKPTSFLASSPNTHLCCHKCLVDLIPTSSIVSKGFTGRHGRAYLVGPHVPTIFKRSVADDPTAGYTSGELPNTLTGKPHPRQLSTGAHTVSDISCRSCGTVLGWKYVEAAEDTQRYKVGKFILETKRVVKSVDWENSGADEEEQEEQGKGSRSYVHMDADTDVQFDSQDEDECEDLFSGVWSPALARRRRKNKALARA